MSKDKLSYLLLLEKSVQKFSNEYKINHEFLKSNRHLILKRTVL